MYRTITILLIMHLIVGVFFGYHEVQSQEAKTARFNYISPIPGSKYIMPQNNIALRHGDPIRIESLQIFSGNCQDLRISYAISVSVVPNRSSSASKSG